MSSPGRFIRLALVFFPLGLIITSIISFGIWWQKRQSVEERSFAHASALRRDMTEVALARYADILREELQRTGAARLAAVASYIDSSMSPENMGFEPNRDRFFDAGQEFSNIEIELTGKQRPREVQLVLVMFGDVAHLDAEVQAIAGGMSLFHSIAGERGEATFRLAAVPLGIRDENQQSALQRLAAASVERQERIVRIRLLGGVAEPVLQEVRAAFRAEQTGVVIESLPASKDVSATLEQMRRLKATR
jgi:hypothetical protein